eukprot:6782217-Prymnesium_polylepis.1
MPRAAARARARDPLRGAVRRGRAARRSRVRRAARGTAGDSNPRYSRRPEPAPTGCRPPPRR